MLKSFAVALGTGTLLAVTLHGGLTAIRNAEPPASTSSCDRATYALLFGDEQRKRARMTDLLEDSTVPVNVHAAARAWLNAPAERRGWQALDVWRAC
jgi:hypothetical protein